MFYRSNWRLRLASAAIFTLASTNAFGEVTNLTCSSIDTAGMDARVTLDSVSKTAVFGSEPVSAATFTDTDIFWHVTYNLAGTDNDVSYTLSRATGDMTRNNIERGNSNGQLHLVYRCDIAKNKF